MALHYSLLAEPRAALKGCFKYAHAEEKSSLSIFDLLHKGLRDLIYTVAEYKRQETNLQRKGWNENLTAGA